MFTLRGEYCFNKFQNIFFLSTFYSAEYDVNIKKGSTLFFKILDYNLVRFYFRILTALTKSNYELSKTQEVYRNHINYLKTNS